MNVSSPNTPGLRALQGRDSLVELLTKLQEINNVKGPKPLFLKVAPDLTDEALLEAASVVTELHCTEWCSRIQRLAEKDWLGLRIAWMHWVMGFKWRATCKSILRSACAYSKNHPDRP